MNNKEKIYSKNTKPKISSTEDEKKKFVVVKKKNPPADNEKKKDSAVKMENQKESNKKGIAAVKKEVHKEKADGTSIQQEENIPLKTSDECEEVFDVTEAIHCWKEEGKILFVEGNNDKEFYKQLVTDTKKIRTPKDTYSDEKKINHQIIELSKDQENIISGNKQKIILYVKKQYACSLLSKNYKAQVFGIVDRDYEENNEDILGIGADICTKTGCENQLYKKIEEISNDISIINKRLINTTDTCDVESLLFKYGNIEKLFITRQTESLSLCGYYLSSVIQKASKLGWLRKKSDKKFKETKQKEGKGKTPITFDMILPHCSNFLKYTMDDDDQDIDNFIDEYFYEYVPKKKLSEWKYKFDFQNIPSSFPDETPWEYCRGHDLTAILSCFIYNADRSQKNIAYINNRLQDEIIKNVDIEDFKESTVYKFIKDNNL